MFGFEIECMRSKILLLIIYFISLMSVIDINKALAQCPNSIVNYPYFENFEASDGGWFAGGQASDWVWGTPHKKVIMQAFSGNYCWITGGLTASAYNNAQQSYLQSPCFNIAALVNPYLSFKVFWETENKYDGASLQYSIDSGKTFLPLGTYADGQACPYDNWFNTVSINTVGGAGWSGNIQPTAACNGGVGGGLGKWVTAKHSLGFLAGQTHVIFRFVFGAGTQCNNYDGFAVDDISIGEQPNNTANFSYTCSVNRYVQFNGNDVVCPSTYLWDFGEPSSPNNTATTQSPSHTYSAPGTYQVRLTITNPNFSTVSALQTVNVIDASTSIVQNILCNGDKNGSVQVTVSGPTNTYNYIWNTSPNQTTPIATNLGAGTYNVSIFATNTCFTEATITLTEPPAVQVQSLITINPKCTTKGSIELNLTGATPPYNYQWLPNVSTTNKAVNLSAGNYMVKVYDTNNCFANIANATLTDLPNTLAVNIGADTSICPGETYILNAGSGYSSYLWQNQSSLPTFSVTNTGNYYVTVTDKDGCTASDSAFVTVNCDDIFFPSAFSPNGDGKNELFGPFGNVTGVTNYTFQVFNRYGNMVFNTSNPSKKWDGKLNGNLLTGVYVWYANYSIRSRKNLFQKGTVLIVR